MKKGLFWLFALLVLALFGCQGDRGTAEQDTITMRDEAWLYEELPTSAAAGDTVTAKIAKAYDVGDPFLVNGEQVEMTVKVTRPDLGIYTGPGYDHADIGTLLDVGTYTITEQVVCDEQITWGKLKSGVGWIDLDKALAEAPHIPITMERIEKDTPDEANCHLYLREETDYTQYLLIQPYESLTDVRLSFMELTDNGFQPGEALYTLETLEPGKPLVLGVVFYGDFTIYGLSFVDAAGNTCRYMIYTSGRNGSVILQKNEN